VYIRRVGNNGDIGVQTETGNRGAPWTVRGVDAFGIDMTLAVSLIFGLR